MTKINDQIKDLEVGGSINYEGNIDSIRRTCAALENKYKVIKTGHDKCMIIRVEFSIKGLKETIIDQIKSIGIFDEIKVTGNIQYIRTIVSKYNTLNGRSINVNKQKDFVILSENVMERTEISPEEFELIKTDFEKKLEILKSKIKHTKKSII